MVAQLDDASMKFVVRGENGDDSVGIISCAVMLRPNSYDPSRHLDAVAAAKANAAKGAPATVAKGVHKGQQQEMQHLLDFVIERSDGASIRLRPRRYEKIVDAFDDAGRPKQVQPLKEGQGPHTHGPLKFHSQGQHFTPPKKPN
jgi:hypothetical protein